MVKKCDILLNNDAVTVVDFGGEKIQMPSIKNNKAKTAFVCEANGRYHFVDGEKCELHAEPVKRKKSKKVEDEIQEEE